MSTRPDARRVSVTTAKVVVTGPFDAGKTTLVNTLCDDAITTERGLSYHDQGFSDQTTVAMDYGRLRVADDLALSLFGTPGQPRFSFMWEILVEGMLGYILLVDDQRPGSVEEAQRIRERFDQAASVPCVVVVNKVTGPAEEAVTRVRQGLDLDDHTPVLVADVRQREDTKRVLLALLGRVLERAEQRATISATRGETG